MDPVERILILSGPVGQTPTYCPSDKNLPFVLGETLVGKLDLCESRRHSAVIPEMCSVGPFKSLSFLYLDESVSESEVTRLPERTRPHCVYFGSPQMSFHSGTKGLSLRPFRSTSSTVTLTQKLVSILKTTPPLPP